MENPQDLVHDLLVPNRVNSKRAWWLLLVLTAVAPSVRAETPARAKALLDKVDDLYRGKSAHGKMTMKVTTVHWTRELSLEFWSKGKERSLIRILAPQKEKGTTTLKVGKEMWNYLPKVDRVIKVPSSMMGGSWMGSHFTNDDLVKESRMAEDYDTAISFEGTREGAEVIELSSIPKKDAAVVWGKVVTLVRKADLIPVKVDYYDEDLHLARRMTFSDVKKMGGRLLPTVLRVVPTDKPNESTEIVYHQVEFDVDLPDNLFTLRNLQR